MKAVASILLSLIVLVGTTGFSINKHYCGGKLKATTLLTNLDPVKCCGKKEMPEGCCHDETSFYSLKDLPSLTAEPAGMSQTSLCPLVAVIPVVNSTCNSCVKSIRFLYHNLSLPPPGDIPILYCSLLF